MAGSKIMFFNATRHHSGIYNCSADNGFSRPLPPTASKTIILDVHRKLTMSKHFLKKQKELFFEKLHNWFFNLSWLCIDKPSIVLQQTFIHTKETDETEIVCVVHASPRATVEWLKDGQKMGDGENKWVSLNI